MVEEVGISSSNLFEDGELTVSEDKVFEHYERLLPRLTCFGFLGVLFWCYGDYAKPLWDQAPFDEQKHERYFGLFHEDLSPKPFVPLLKSLQAKKEAKSVSFGWIDIEPEEYFQAPLAHLYRLYRNFKERGLERIRS
jgi:hypothetical protein